MLATVYPYLGKKGKYPRTVGVRREGREKCRGKKVFRKILTLGEWAPLFSPDFHPYPPLDIPQGVSRGTAWHGLGIDRHGLGTAWGLAWAIDRAWRMALAWLGLSLSH